MSGGRILVAVKIPKLVLALSALSLSAFAQAPDSLVGFVYHEVGTYAGPSPRPTQEIFAATFTVEGAYNQLFFIHSAGAGIPQRLRDPQMGPYTYRKIDEVTAEFSLGGVQAGLLKFDSPTALTGTFVDPNRPATDLSGVVRQFSSGSGESSGAAGQLFESRFCTPRRQGSHGFCYRRWRLPHGPHSCGGAEARFLRSARSFARSHDDCYADECRRQR